MSYSKPFHRNFRGFVERDNSRYSQWAYIVDQDYAVSPEHYTRAFKLIQSDLIKLFEYIEPSDQNLKTYSYRIHELFMRTCIEVEANFKAILKENTYNPVDRNGDPITEDRWNIHNYWKINKTHHLSSYKIHVPIWDGTNSIYEPFKEWNNVADLQWYSSYNKSKHDRHKRFKEANLKNLLNSVTGLLGVLSSQFRTEDFSTAETSLTVNTDSFYSTQPALGGFFHIEFPDDWTESEKYDFDWSDLKEQTNRFNKINYDRI